MGGNSFDDLRQMFNLTIITQLRGKIGAEQDSRLENPEVIRRETQIRETLGKSELVQVQKVKLIIVLSTVNIQWTFVLTNLISRVLMRRNGLPLHPRVSTSLSLKQKKRLAVYFQSSLRTRLMQEIALFAYLPAQSHTLTIINQSLSLPLFSAHGTCDFHS